MKRRQQGILTGMPFMANVAGRTFADDLGRRVYLAKPARRIVSLSPSSTEILFVVGLDSEILGVTTCCDYPPQAKFFFFSSRRRHTRFDCDWSSDVCSSD